MRNKNSYLVDMKTIMGRGTGQLDIFRKESTDKHFREETGGLQNRLPSEAFVKFMTEGPLNEYTRAEWSPDKKIKERRAAKELAVNTPHQESRKALPSGQMATARLRGVSADSSAVVNSDHKNNTSSEPVSTSVEIDEATTGHSLIMPVDEGTQGGLSNHVSEDDDSLNDEQSISEAMSITTEDGDVFYITVYLIAVRVTHCFYLQAKS